MALTALVLLASAAGLKRDGGGRTEEKGMRRSDNSPVQQKSPKHYSADRSSNDGRRVNSRRIVERVEYEYEYDDSESEEDEYEPPRWRDNRRRRPPPPPRRQHGRYWDDNDCYADNENVDDYGIPLYFFVFTNRPPRPRTGFFVFAFMGGQPPNWFRNRVTTRKFTTLTTGSANGNWNN